MTTESLTAAHVLPATGRTPLIAQAAAARLMLIRSQAQRLTRYVLVPHVRHTV